MQPLIKWPGGKSSELEIIKRHMPEKYDRYVEPFLGGGALFFDLAPEKSLINDLSQNLMRLYAYIAEGNRKFEKCVLGIADEWDLVKKYCAEEAEKLVGLYSAYSSGECDADAFSREIALNTDGAVEYIAGRSQVISDKETFKKELFRTAKDKLMRTAQNEKKFGGLSEEDLKKNILTGFTSGYYMYMRTMLNAMEKDKYLFVSDEYKTAVFFFVREFCYGAMFRYNGSGDFNVPYGGIAYNGKDFGKKAEALFLPETKKILSSARILSTDFGNVFAECGEGDFVFLDPPYDTDFSEYETNVFGKKEHERLAECLYNTKAKFLLIIKNTPFIAGLYDDKGFNIYSFDNKYAYCVKGRNDRNAEHFIITNY